METDVPLDKDLLQRQWQDIVTNLRQAGATVEIMEPVDGLPDLVFTANAGLVNGRSFIPSTFKYPERQPEVPYNNAWFEHHGLTITPFSHDPDLYFEGLWRCLYGARAVCRRLWLSHGACRASCDCTAIGRPILFSQTDRPAIVPSGHHLCRLMIATKFRRPARLEPRKRQRDDASRRWMACT